MAAFSTYMLNGEEAFTVIYIISKTYRQEVSPPYLKMLVNIMYPTNEIFSQVKVVLLFAQNFRNSLQY